MTVLDFAPEHALSSNELVEVVKKNILLGDWGDEDHNESLLSMRNSKWGQEMLKNVRCVGVFQKCVLTFFGSNMTMRGLNCVG